MPSKSSRTSAGGLAKLLPLLLLLGACATGAIRERVLTMPQIQGASYVARDSCAACHEDLAKTFAGTVHGRLADFELMGGTGGCQACHGPGSLHVEEGDTTKILRFSELQADQTAAVCAQCHSDGKLIDWSHSQHALADVGCTDCHLMHSTGKTARYSLKKPDPELCYDCHREQQAKASFPSHHPIKEGKMTCSSCHNAHGELQTEERANDLCLNCHARYQGPFVFEHAPVQENCMICHDPHGTVANNLLQQNEPFLCLQCHESHFHITRDGASVPANNIALDAYNADGTLKADYQTGDTITTANGVPITNTLGSDSWRMAFGTKCTVCHSQVHGSDLPSQTAPTVNSDGTQGWPDGGQGLTR